MEAASVCTSTVGRAWQGNLFTSRWSQQPRAFDGSSPSHKSTGELHRPTWASTSTGRSFSISSTPAVVTCGQREEGGERGRGVGGRKVGCIACMHQATVHFTPHTSTHAHTQPSRLASLLTMTKRGATPRFWLVSSSRTAVSSRPPSSRGAGRGTLLQVAGAE